MEQAGACSTATEIKASICAILHLKGISMTRSFARGVPAFLLLLGAVVPAFAHAILLKSVPAANAVVAQPTTNISLTFNSKIDGRRSRLTLIGPDGSEQTIAMAPQNTPDTLTAAARDLKSGDYRLRWQVLAVDGHITRGEISFRVKLP